MKKILITGMNKNQCTFDFYLQQQLQVIPSHYSLIRCLTDMGYDVTQRPVTIGESLSEYDEVIVFLHSPGGFAGYIYNALWVVSQRPDCIMAFDDWQIDSIYSGIEGLHKDLFRKFIKDSHTNIPDDVEKYEPEFINALSTITSKSNRMLISAFGGGDASLLLDYPSDLLFTYNPNPYHLHREVQVSPFEDVVKQRVFNFAGLVQNKTKKWLKNQNVEKTGWELKLYGSRKDGQDRVTESEMVNLYGKHWGVLMAGYDHAGSGWWRARPLQVAMAGSIIIGEKKELMVLYGDEQLSSLKANDLVSMSDSDLTEISASQYKALSSKHPLDKEIQRKELLECINH